MISPGASSQLVTHLNEAYSSLGTLKTCLCSRGTKMKIRHERLSSILSCLPKLDKQVKKILPIISDLPRDWLKDVSVPNTIWIKKPSLLEWNTSHISGDTFSLNKKYILSPFDSICSPLYPQRMRLNRKSYIQNIQRRYIHSSTYTPSDTVIFLEKYANKWKDNQHAQYEYLKTIVDEDPDYVIRRYESGRFANNEQTKEVYMKALSNRFSGGKSDDINSEELSSRGTKEKPLHVKDVTSKGKSATRFLNLIFNISFIIYLVYFWRKMMRNIGDKDFAPEVIDKETNFGSVQGCDEAKEELEEVVQFLKNPEKFEKLGAKIPRGVLLIGPPGTGKTLLARAIAGEADVPFFFASGSEFDEMYVGVGAARIRKLFAAAKEHAPAIIFIDELDAVGGKRNGNHQYAHMTLNQLLVELDGFKSSDNVIVVAATNFPALLDPALIRPGRFDSKVIVPLPDIRGRSGILSLYIDKSLCEDDVDVDEIARATVGFCGANLRNLVNQAALRAASLELPLITRENFDWARDKISMGSERKSAVIDEEDKVNTAYHEGGHAIVGLFTEGATPVIKATILPRGDALGYILCVPDKDRNSMSRKQLLAELDVGMGGRVAEEMIFGEENVTTGASSDMKAATQIARNMVTKWGMSEKIGTVEVDENGPVSPELQRLVESEIKRLVEEAYIRAKKLLNKYSKEHKRLAEGLLKYETLNKEEIDLVIKGYPLKNK